MSPFKDMPDASGAAIGLYMSSLLLRGGHASECGKRYHLQRDTHNRLKVWQ